MNAYRFRGNVCLSADENWLLVDNLTNGFDLYQYPQSLPSDSFPIPREKAIVQEGIFLENETSIACGSDHGDIYIFSQNIQVPAKAQAWRCEGSRPSIGCMLL